MLKEEGRNNIGSSYAYAASHGIGYHLAFIPQDAPDITGDTAKDQFSTAYMRQIFAIGEAQGRTRSPWVSRPPFAQDSASGDMTAAR